MRHFKTSVLVVILGLLASLLVLQLNQQKPLITPNLETLQQTNAKHWFLLERKSKIEKLFFGTPGDISNSQLVKQFNINPGAADSPTPLPQLLGREYWLVIGKTPTPDDPETAPYFLILDIPYAEVEPYGPTPYLECNGQCNWKRAGSFGLHGTAQNPLKLVDLGSSGCIRHKDEDITYLYNLIDPSQEVRYYINDI